MRTLKRLDLGGSTKRPSRRAFASLGLVAIAALAFAPSALADDPIPAPAPPGEAPAPEAAPAKLSTAELKELVGPVALYPDVILASLLPATTNPLDLMAAARFLKEQGGSVRQVPADRTWDPSVKAMLQYPAALQWMADNPEWLKRFGQAVAVQQADVLAAIQAFRAEAKRAGNLKSDDHVTVTTPEPGEVFVGPPPILIEPCEPAIVYVPVYDPIVVCQPWYGVPLFRWSIGTDCGPFGPWGWNSICWDGCYGNSFFFGGATILSAGGYHRWADYRHHRYGGTPWRSRSLDPSVTYRPRGPSVSDPSVTYRPRERSFSRSDDRAGSGFFRGRATAETTLSGPAGGAAAAAVPPTPSPRTRWGGFQSNPSDRFGTPRVATDTTPAAPAAATGPRFGSAPAWGLGVQPALPRAPVTETPTPTAPRRTWFQGFDRGASNGTPSGVPSVPASGVPAWGSGFTRPAPAPVVRLSTPAFGGGFSGWNNGNGFRGGESSPSRPAFTAPAAGPAPSPRWGAAWSSFRGRDRSR